MGLGWLRKPFQGRKCGQEKFDMVGGSPFTNYVFMTSLNFFNALPKHGPLKTLERTSPVRQLELPVGPLGGDMRNPHAGLHKTRFQAV